MTLTYTSARDLISPTSGMNAEDTAQVLDLLMSGNLNPEQGAQLLINWNTRGETGIELAAVVQGLLQRAVHVPLQGPCFDLCGTGGSRLTRFNVSTTVAFILAAAGIPVAKHGNKGSARPNGSFDLLEALGIPFQLSPTALAQLCEETKLCFLFARAMHPAVAAVAPFRKIAAAHVRRTIFNLAGPLANPCRPQAQLIGVTDERTALVIADALEIMGIKRAIVVRGHPGIDEVSITGASQMWDLRNGERKSFVRETHPHTALSHEQLPGGDASENADIFRRIIDGTETGPITDMVIANAGVALDCWANVPITDHGPGMAQARELLASGAVQRCFTRHVHCARQLASIVP